MTELVATTPGLFPLPDDAKETLAELKGHQKHDLIDGDEPEAVRGAYDEARQRLLATQRDAGLDRVVEGQARWDDMLAHPLAVHDAVETRGIVRYYDNNNFYREPVVTAELGFHGDVAADLEGVPEPGRQGVLPGPYTLADLATDEHYGDEAAFLGGVADFLADEAEALPAVETLVLLEPSLVASPPGGDLDERAAEAVDRVAAAVDGEVVVQAPWGSLTEKVHAHLLDTDVDAIGYDLVAAHEENRELVAEYGTADAVALGVVDGQNTVVESSSTIRERVEWFRDGVPGTFDAVYVTPNTELFYLPVGKFEAKLAALGEAADRPLDAEREVRA